MSKRINRFIAVIISAILVLSLCACSGSASSEPAATVEESTETIAIEEDSEVATEKAEGLPKSNTENAETAQDTEEWTNEKCIEYINSCKPVAYSDLARYPDRYVNTPVSAVLCVKQVIDDGSFMGYDRMDNEFANQDPMDPLYYCNNQYVFYDSRVNDSAKILTDDIVTIYGDYVGPTTFTVAINGVDVDIPAIDARFIDFWDTEITDGVDTLFAQDYNDDTDYVLQYDSDLEEQQRLDEEWEWRSAKMEAEKYIIYDSDVRNLTYDDIQYLSKDDIRLAKNEIYARHGYIFKSDDLNGYFNQRWWYMPQYTSDTFDESVFNEYEKNNIEFLDEAYNNM